MLDKIIENLQIVLDYKASDIAIENALLSRLNFIFSFKSVSFNSIQNLRDAFPMSYYCFNFVPSGGIKNRLISEIDNSLLKFFDDYLKKYNDNRYDHLEGMQELELQKITDKIEFRRKKQEQAQDLKAFKKLNKDISNATQAKIYNSAQIIKESKIGALFIVNTEFANFFEDAILNRDKIKKEFMDMLFDLYDGDLSATDTMALEREKLRKIPTSCALMSDYKLISENSKCSSAFKSYLARGLARRSFIYFKKKENSKFLQNEKMPTVQEKEEAYKQLDIYAEKLKNIFNELSEHKNYLFSPSCNQSIIEYKEQVDERVKDFYKYTNNLDTDSEIQKLNIQHSTWKIIKLAVLYHILQEPYKSFIEVDKFNKASVFFEKTHACLIDLLNDKVLSDYDNLLNYLIRNRNKFISKTDLRNEKFVNSREFKMWFEDALVQIEQSCEERKDFKIVTRVTGKRNQGLEVALYEPDKFDFQPFFDGPHQKGKLVDKNPVGNYDITEI